MIDLLDASKIVGSWCWRQARGFEVVGGWVQPEVNPEAKIQFFAHSRRKGAHARVLAGLIPVIAGSDPASLARPAPGDDELIEALERATTSGSNMGGSEVGRTEARLAALYEILSPREIADIRGFLKRTAPVGSMPAIRAAAAVLADEEQDHRTGAALLARIRN